jgi:hypothetical protein
LSAAALVLLDGRVIDELLAVAAVTDDDECAEDEERLVVFDVL